MNDHERYERARQGLGKFSKRAKEIHNSRASALGAYATLAVDRATALAAALDEAFELPPLTPWSPTMRDAVWP